MQNLDRIYVFFFYVLAMFFRGQTYILTNLQIFLLVMKNFVIFTVLFLFLCLTLFQITTTWVYISKLLKQSSNIISYFSLKTVNDQSLKNDPNVVNGEYYAGTFYSTQQKNIYDYIESKQGHTLLAFYGMPINNQIFMTMYIHDPFYHDGRSIQIIAFLDTLDHQDSWVKKNDTIQIAKYYKQRLSFDNDQIIADYTIKLQNIQSGDPDKITVLINMQADNFNFTAQLSHNYYPWATLGYTFFVLIYVLIQLIIGQIFLNRVNSDIVESRKISLVSLTMCCYMDISLSLEHFSGSFQVNILQTAAFLTYFYKIQLLLITHVWKNTYLIGAPNRNEIKKRIVIFLTLFFMGIFGYLAIVEFFNYSQILMILQHCFMVPQIIHNVKTGKRGCWRVEYIIGFFLCRYFFILYERACPSNFGKLTQMPVFISLLGVLYFLQLSVLFAQYKFGGRFFIPKSLRPGYYDYTSQLIRTPQNEHLECTICIQNIFEQQYENTGSQYTAQTIIEQRLLDKAIVMKTPCKHYFHKQCLLKWIQVKLQCPTCRSPLPLLN